VDYNYATGVDSNISRLTSISDASGTLEAYSYQGDGTVLTVDRTQPGLTLTKTLDDFGRVMDFNWTNGSGSIVRYEYGYDANSNVLYKEDLVNGGLSELYGYDALNQIASMARGTLNGGTTAITGTPDFEQSWNHDSLGNWDDVTTNGVVEDRESNAQNEYTTANGNSPAYDANGNMTTDQTGRHFVWDAWNRLVEVQNSSSTTLVTYSYDSLNRRVTSDDGTTVTNLYYSVGWQVLQEQVAGNVTQQYVYSATYPDAMILRDRDTDNDGIVDERLWVIQDNNFNVMALVDDTGAVVERYKYTAFGVATIMDASYTVLGSSAHAWVHLHQGLRLEEASGLYDNRWRWYSAELGQFVSNDPIGFNAGDVNVRRYVGNGAVGAVDPLGLEEKERTRADETKENVSAMVAKLHWPEEKKEQITQKLNFVIDVAQFEWGRRKGTWGYCNEWTDEFYWKIRDSLEDLKKYEIRVHHVGWSTGWITGHEAMRISVSDKPGKANSSFDFYLDDGYVGGDDGAFVECEIAAKWGGRAKLKLDIQLHKTDDKEILKDDFNINPPIGPKVKITGVPKYSGELPLTTW